MTSFVILIQEKCISVIITIIVKIIKCGRPRCDNPVYHSKIFILVTKNMLNTYVKYFPSCYGIPSAFREPEFLVSKKTMHEQYKTDAQRAIPASYNFQRERDDHSELLQK